MTISVGITDYESTLSVYDLSDQADNALYASKAGGRNTVTVYTKELQTKAPESKDTLLPKKIFSETVDVMSKEESVPNNGIIILLREKMISSIILAVHWMTPFIAGGGILIGLAFLFDVISVDVSTLSATERASLGSITQISSIMKSLGDTTFNFMLPVFAAFMAYGLAGEGAFMAGFIGGYLLTDSNCGFAGAIIAGCAAGIVTYEVKQFTERMPVIAKEAFKVVFSPVFTLIIMQILTTFVISPVTSVLNSMFTALLDAAVSVSPLLSSALSAGMMAMDMGGIINKSAYTYGLSSILSEQTYIMAAVMAGGMVPPIGVALSAMIFRKKYPKAAQSHAIYTLFMGLSFITEGVLPYLIADITKVLPACIAGSVISGFLSALFGCTLVAPHGGIFVLPLIGNAPLFMIAVSAGSLFTAILLGLTKKTPSEAE